MGKNQGRTNSDIDTLRIFLFSFEEYQRFTACFGRICSRDSLIQEDAYIFLQTRLMLIRKYEAKGDAVYLKKVLEAFKNTKPELTKEVTELTQKIDDIETQKLEIYLSDGTKRDLRESVEDVLYGMYLHADINKIETLIKTNMSTYMFVVERYVYAWEKLLTDSYKLINGTVEDKYSREEFGKASIIFTGSNDLQGQDIKSAPYWSNLRGRDAETNDIRSLLDSLTQEEKGILSLVNSFITELKRHDYSRSRLRKMIHPVVKPYWGDFKTIHNELENMEVGLSGKVRFNESHNIAYVLLFKHVSPGGVFIIDQPHYSEDIVPIYLKKDSERTGWKIVSVNDEPDKIITTITIDPNTVFRGIMNFFRGN